MELWLSCVILLLVVYNVYKPRTRSPTRVLEALCPKILPI